MKRAFSQKTHIPLLSLPALILSSCSQEELPGRVATTDDITITFITSLPGVGSRSLSGTEEKSLDAGFDVTAFSKEGESDSDGKHNTFFEEQHVSKDVDGAFRSESCRWPDNKGDHEGHLKFFAFYPSRDAMHSSIAEDEDSGHFNLTNHSAKDENEVIYDYRLENFKIHRDISRHIDFVTAAGEGTKTENLYSGVNLEFQHHLSRISLQAWGASTDYNVEIAGVRIGRPVTEGDFNLAATSEAISDGDNTIGAWILGETPIRNSVEYIFSDAGDSVIPIDGKSHTTQATAASVMGLGGYPMVIPYSHEAWDHNNDAPNENEGMYFSVLLRVCDKSGLQLYPYPATAAGEDESDGDEKKMAVIYLSVDPNTGKVLKRLYKVGDSYYTDPESSADTLYSADEAEEIREYGWAAVPVKTEWKAGYEYTYALDYTKGVGVQDPEDPYPGTPILMPLTTGADGPDMLEEVTTHKVTNLDVINKNKPIQMGK